MESSFRRGNMQVFLPYLACLSIALFSIVHIYYPGTQVTALENPSVPSSINHDRPPAYGDLPLFFIGNEGQLDNRVHYYEQGAGHAIYFTSTGAHFVLRQVGNERQHEIALNFMGAHAEPKISGRHPQQGRVNYFIGSDPRQWVTGIATYGEIAYKNLYPGIDMKFYGRGQELEYDIIIAPGSDPSQIAFSYNGIDSLQITEDGNLKVRLDDGFILQKKPLLYQEIEGRRIEIPGRFRLLKIKDAKRVQAFGFEVGDYDKSYPLTIDPILLYSTYLGGSSHEQGAAIAVDGSGNTYLTGVSRSMNYPVAAAYKAAGAANYNNIIITKINASGSALVYSTYLGGSNNDEGLGIAVDTVGNAYITGKTRSSNFPMVNAIQVSNSPNYDDAFLVKLNPSGGVLLYSTYIGGSKDDVANGIAVDGMGNMYITGNTRSHDFPTFNPLYTSIDTGNNKDAFVAKLNASGSAYIYSTYLGGDNADKANAIAVDSFGNAYVTGSTESPNFPTTPSAYGGVFTIAFSCAFVTKLDAAGSQVLYSTYLGGKNDDAGYGIAVDSNENAYVTGMTRSPDFPTVSPLYTAVDTANSQDAFVARIDTLASGAASLIYSTYLGGTNRDEGKAIAVTSTGDAYVTGYTRSSDFPVILGSAFQGSNAGLEDVFITKINALGTALVFSTYLGGVDEDKGAGLALDAVGNAYVTGETRSADFPVVAPLQTSSGGYRDVFVAKIQ